MVTVSRGEKGPPGGLAEVVHVGRRTTQETPEELEGRSPVLHLHTLSQRLDGRPRVGGAVTTPPADPRLRLKRLMDVGGSALLLVVLAIPMLAISVAIRRDVGSPVVFRQSRPGLHGRRFTLYKFRTMRDPGPDATADEYRL